MDNEATSSQSRWDIVITILIAVIVAIAAIVSWWASLAADGAGDANFEALRALVNIEEARALNAVNAYEDYRSFTIYKKYKILGDLIAEDLERITDEDEYDEMEASMASAYDMATLYETLFPGRFLTRDGSYDLQRQLDEMWADVSQEKDVNPTPKLSEADYLSVKNGFLLATATILAVTLVCYTLVESVSGVWKYVMAGLGTTFALVAIVTALIVQLTM